MTYFINNPYSDHHHGADRVEAVMDAAQHLPEGIAGKRGVALLLGSAMAAAVMAVAYEVMDSADESHLLMIWVGLWLALFALLAFFAGALRATGMRFKRSLDAWSLALAEARADQRLWASAKADPRIMADLQMAITRSEVQAEANAVPAATARAERALKSRSYSILRAYERHYL
ncbi:hypothetical protein [Polaromonas naphthalenivorans]|uniref:Transmembrane protein n=1 Tax=Polaromonas naphthalenivorans (strain CJ2) TaxID=365044 RepID=A1VIE8_POLNA|nr:hypothetical protein [Polaromonas naphthalenivorans]ABM35426.1 conserved hypothetical protein [Polaromonas naphthalenivorans CJ2]